MLCCSNHERKTKSLKEKTKMTEQNNQYVILERSHLQLSNAIGKKSNKNKPITLINKDPKYHLDSIGSFVYVMWPLKYIITLYASFLSKVRIFLVVRLS
ncbi:MAG: hypothetical protein IPL08_11395 [Saprospiraceae bacterium]|nr:hypothetical protein [Saprospiraceae bacterium]